MSIVIFGQTITLDTVIPVGVVLFVLLIFQVLVGKRIIHFKGRTHLRVHRWTAFVLVFLATVHGLLGLVATYGWNIL